VIKPLPLYGRGRDATVGRYTSLIFGTNLTDVIVIGMQKVTCMKKNMKLVVNDW